MEAPISGLGDGMEPIDPNLNRVTGWLALFCAGQIVIGPLVSLGSLVEFSESYEKLYPTFPALRTMVSFTECIYVIIAIFGIYSGLMVNGKRRNAILIAKWYLLTLFAGRTVCAVFPFVMGLPPDFTNARVESVITEVIKVGLTVCIWYAYLSCSKRVKTIFGNEVSNRNPLFYLSLVSASFCVLFAMSFLSSQSQKTQNEISAKAIAESKDPIYFKSDSGKFSIALPYGSRIPERKDEVLKTDAGPMTSSTYLVEFPNSAYNMSYYEIPQTILKVKSVDRLLKDSAEGVAKATNLQITSYERFSFNGLPATHANLTGKIEGTIVTGRFDLILSGGRMYALFALAKTKEEIEGATVRAFFDSFHITS